MGVSEKNVASYGANTTEAGLDGSQETLVVKPLKSWKGYLWDTFELPPDQRWLLFKLDAFVLTFASVRMNHQILHSDPDSPVKNRECFSGYRLPRDCYPSF